MLKSLDPFRFLLITVPGWMNQRQLQVIAYLREENCVLREQLSGRLSPRRASSVRGLAQEARRS